MQRFTACNLAKPWECIRWWIDPRNSPRYNDRRETRKQQPYQTFQWWSNSLRGRTWIQERPDMLRPCIFISSKGKEEKFVSILKKNVIAGKEATTCCSMRQIYDGFSALEDFNSKGTDRRPDVSVFQSEGKETDCFFFKCYLCWLIHFWDLISVWKFRFEVKFTALVLRDTTLKLCHKAARCHLLYTYTLTSFSAMARLRRPCVHFKRCRLRPVGRVVQAACAEIPHGELSRVQRLYRLAEIINSMTTGK